MPSSAHIIFIACNLAYSYRSIASREVQPFNKYGYPVASPHHDGTGIFALVRTIRQVFTESPQLFLLNGSCSELTFIQGAASYDTNGNSYRKHFILPWNDPLCSLLFSNNSTALESYSNRFILMPHTPSTACQEAFIADEILQDLSRSLGWERFCILYTDEYELCADIVSTGIWRPKQQFTVIRIDPWGQKSLKQQLVDCVNFGRQNFKDIMILADRETTSTVFAKMHELSRELQGLSETARLFVFTQALQGDSARRVLTGTLRNIAFFELTKLSTDPSENITYSVTSIVSNNGSMAMRRTLGWDHASNMYRYDHVFPSSRYMLNQVNLKVTTKVWQPFTVKTKENGTVAYTGLCMDLLEELALRLNFSYTVEEPPDLQWGALKNGSWTGMIGQLVRKEVDVMIGAISIQKEREDVMDFTYPFFHDSSAMILKKSLSVYDVWAKIFRPFHWTTLLLIAASIAVLGRVLSIVEMYHPMYRKPQQSHFGRWDTCIWYLLAALLREGGEETTRSQSGRTIIATWWLFSIVVMGMYTGDLIGSFAITSSNVPFNSLNGLVRQKEYKWGVEEGAYITMLLPVSSNEDYKEVWRGVEKFQKEDPALVSTNISYHLDRVNQGNYVFLNDKSMLSLEAEKNCESLVVLRETFLTLQFAVGLHQNSTYREMFSEQILFYQEAGMITALTRKWWPKNVTCDRKSQKTETHAVGFHHMQGLYIFSSCVIAMSGIILIVENIAYHLNKKRTSRRSER